MACDPKFYSRQEGITLECTYLDFAIGALSSKPRGKEGGRVKTMLQIADCLGGGDGSGLVYC